MSSLKRPAVRGILIASAIAAIALATGYLTAETQGLSGYNGGPVAVPLNQNLPPVTRGPMTVTPVDGSDALSILSFDDGTCESGLGAGTAASITDYVDFDVPTQCIQSGLEVVAVTTRMNTGQTIVNFAYGQSAPGAPLFGAGSLIPITGIPPVGPCPATALTSRAVSPAAVITGTNNFFAGVAGAGFVGRDTNGPPAGRIWLNCGTCGMTQYTPTTLSSLGLGGNWMIRVTVEDANCVPVELMELTVS